MLTDHARGCQGREYACSCGYDTERDTALAELQKRVSFARSLIILAADHIQEQRDEIFHSHTIDGKFTILDASDALSAETVKELDSWLLSASEFCRGEQA